MEKKKGELLCSDADDHFDKRWGRLARGSLLLFDEMTNIIRYMVQIFFHRAISQEASVQVATTSDGHITVEHSQ